MEQVVYNHWLRGGRTGPGAPAQLSAELRIEVAGRGRDHAGGDGALAARTVTLHSSSSLVVAETKADKEVEKEVEEEEED